MEFPNVHVVESLELNFKMENDPKMIKIGFKSTRKAAPLNQWLVTNNFPKGFQILCWNCNFAKGMLGKCPHQN